MGIFNVYNSIGTTVMKSKETTSRESIVLHQHLER
jgi:hypothetical protein